MRPSGPFSIEGDAAVSDKSGKTVGHSDPTEVPSDASQAKSRDDATDVLEGGSPSPAGGQKQETADLASGGGSRSSVDSLTLEATPSGTAVGAPTIESRSPSASSIDTPTIDLGTGGSHADGDFGTMVYDPTQ